MPRRNFLSNVTVPAPCKADWNSMVGNEQVRFCEHCSLEVHDISAMTRTQAQRLVARSNGRLCIQYLHDPEGRVLPPPLFPKLHRINRRVSRIAAGAFSATLSITSAAAQSTTRPDVNQPSASQTVRRWVPGATISGTIKDERGAVISGATLFISNTALNVALYASTNINGEFDVNNLEPGAYLVRVAAPGFAAAQSENLYLQASGSIRFDRTLKVEQIEEPVTESTDEVQIFRGGGAIAIVEPSHPFVKAAAEDDLETLTSLISGTDVNLRDSQSQTTALEHAVKNANREMVQLLLSSGADVNATNEAGESVLMMIDDDSTSDLVWDLINSGGKVNHQDKSGNTPLMQAAGLTNLDALKTLLEAGADVNAKNEDGETALMLAAAEGLVNNVRALLLAGGDLNAKDDEDMTALSHAIDGDHPVVIRFLKSKGAVETVAQARKEE